MSIHEFHIHTKSAYTHVTSERALVGPLAKVWFGQKVVHGLTDFTARDWGKGCENCKMSLSKSGILSLQLTKHPQ